MVAYSSGPSDADPFATGPAGGIRHFQGLFGPDALGLACLSVSAPSDWLGKCERDMGENHGKAIKSICFHNIWLVYRLCRGWTHSLPVFLQSPMERAPIK